MYLEFKNLKISSKKREVWLEDLNETSNDVFRCENAKRYVPLMELQFKLQKTAQITYLEANKQQRRCCVTYLDVSKYEESCDECFEGHRIAGKLNVTFLAI